MSAALEVINRMLAGWFTETERAEYVAARKALKGKSVMKHG